jgi:hypothetical protein
LEHQVDENLQFLGAEIVIERLVVFLLHCFDRDRRQPEAYEYRVHQEARRAPVPIEERMNAHDLRMCPNRDVDRRFS